MADRDPITLMVEQVVRTLIRQDEPVEVAEFARGRVLVIAVRFQSRGAASWVIGRGGTTIDALRHLAVRAASNRAPYADIPPYEDVAIRVENINDGAYRAPVGVA